MAIVNSYRRSNLYRGWNVDETWSSFLAHGVEPLGEVGEQLAEARGPDEQVAAIAVGRLLIAERLVGERERIDHTVLCLDPRTELGRLWKRLDWTWTDTLDAVLAERSTPSVPASGPLDTRKASLERLDGWRRELSLPRIRRLRRFLAPFDRQLWVAVNRRPLTPDEVLDGGRAAARLALSKGWIAHRRERPLRPRRSMRASWNGRSMGS